MTRIFFLLLSIVPLLTPLTASADEIPEQLIDLSHPYDAKTIYWPTEDGFVLEKEFGGKTPAGYWYASNKLRTPEHGGTHIDAPLHFAEGHASVDQIPLDRLVGDAVVIDVHGDVDHQISTAEIAAWEKDHGAIPQHAIVLFKTGWSRFWPDRKTYLGTDERGQKAVSQLHFPGLSPDAARWLLKERAPKAVGIDTASIDYGQSKLFETHRALFAADVPAFENLDALDRLPPRGAKVIALPMKIAGGSGAPLRAIAILPSRR
jgi:kynurenine formamidase